MKYVILEFKNRHTKNNHKEAEMNGRITEKQQAMRETFDCSNPNCSAGGAERATQNLYSESKVPPDKIHRVRRNVSVIAKN